MSAIVPLEGKEVSMYVKVSPSGSFPTLDKSSFSGTPSVASKVWLVTVGASFTAVIFIVTVAASLSNVPSLTLNVKLSLVAESDVLI